MPTIGSILSFNLQALVRVQNISQSTSFYSHNLVVVNLETMAKQRIENDFTQEETFIATMPPKQLITPFYQSLPFFSSKKSDKSNALIYSIFFYELSILTFSIDFLLLEFSSKMCYGGGTIVVFLYCRLKQCGTIESIHTCHTWYSVRPWLIFFVTGVPSNPGTSLSPSL